MIIGKNLTKIFYHGYIRKTKIVAVNNVSLKINENETVCLIGESGSGKSTLGHLLLRLIKPDKGDIYFYNSNITKMKEKEIRKIRKYLQLIPQHPDLSLNPRWKIKKSLLEPLILNKIENKDEVLRRVLYDVGIKEELLDRYPHEVSGGELQRVIIARAISLKPKFIVCDEPTSMLDISTQASILNLLKKIKEEYKLSYLFITHDLDVAKIMGDKFLVMYRGEIIEENDNLEKPLHPYTEMLLNRKRLLENNGNVNNGCKFFYHCPYAEEICFKEEPPTVEVNGKKVKCFKYLK
ncbi:nickel-transporting ATPase [Methanocaldococcus villosus KIN24-T80]|uniref:Nickel-transporting ATPase n=1 Tax=Methanocaldococcus villosus KIN24-T80 TaxID=1069083 RepID=N6VT41_9EURY|nr:ABC transporter ATP-binding protein [Methanocaldococcus villosus]ENN96361.1 nickel-transporting ATPase [Methanocaldococcus villosus KIN24-T80]